MSGIGDSKHEIGMLRPRLYLWLIADDAASRGSLGRGPLRDNLIGVSLEHDCLAVDEDSLMVTLTRRLPDPAKLRQLRIFALITSGARAVHQRAGTSTPPTQLGICSCDALPDFCSIAICRWPFRLESVARPQRLCPREI